MFAFPLFEESLQGLQAFQHFGRCRLAQERNGFRIGDPVVILPSVPGPKTDTHPMGGTRGSLTFPMGPYAQDGERAAGIPSVCLPLLPGLIV